MTGFTRFYPLVTTPISRINRFFFTATGADREDAPAMAVPPVNGFVDPVLSYSAFETEVQKVPKCGRTD